MPFYRHGFLRTLVASQRVVVSDPMANAEAVIELLKNAEAQSVALAVFPELCLTGYTCADLFGQDVLLRSAEQALQQVMTFCKTGYRGVAVVGLPLRIGPSLFNMAAVVHLGRLLGLVPKSYLPNYKEFYEHRWFAPAAKLTEHEVAWQGKTVPVGTDLLFQAENVPELLIGVEICEDLWMPIPPSSLQALHGATVLVNPSASTELIGKVNYRRSLVSQQSGRCLAAYLYAGSSVTESTTDVIFGGHSMIAEAGSILKESSRFQRTHQATIADVDLERIAGDRRRQPSFADALYDHTWQQKFYRTISFHLDVAAESQADLKLQRTIDAHPFVPKANHDRDERCEEVFQLQTAGLAKRLDVLGRLPLTIGVSGGLDSTLALLVACQTLELLKRSNSELTGFVMPGFGSTEKTKQLGLLLLEHMGVTAKIVDIRELCLEQMKQLGHRPFGIELQGMNVDGFAKELLKVPLERRHDLIFENVQARMRTSMLMNAGFVVGTGDLSELALGWCTYNGDHISMYNPNVSVPKTLVRFLIRWIADTHYQGKPLQELLHQIAGQVITPELLPTGQDGQVQSTEASVGPYELQDFYLYHFLRFGFSPAKLLYLAHQAAFDVPLAAADRKHWLQVFLKRFFTNQFKRSCLPDGPKVGSVSLSPRGDWRMPSDATVAAWLRDLEL